jgi:hypothetical protein
VTRHLVRLEMRPPSWVQRLWYRRLRIPPPLATSGGRGSEAWARLVPYRWRAFHRRYATKHHYFWLPCILCNRPFGGHESGDSIPDPTGLTGTGIMICSQCTRAGRGWRVPHPLEAVIDGIYERGEHGHDELTPGCPACELIDAEIRHAFASYKEGGT